ncbi:uncharacterized protein CIMG_06497 [Coccidioides immitis RS]|uniref:Protein kinase domain-containing protein n=1 Tax=Coccidioides immitis (strain RS) TaxID=246410 RepID=A0A0E1RXI2_COCIM|nr:uncharacterized protein CIMG_06497 [Coccidioides immitis RS]EAS31018.1 hypothetical protein CIMG_06497 [Coccidioides immitis RS]
MDSFQSVVAAVEIVQVTIKVLRVGYDTVSDVKQYGTDAAKLGLKFQQLSHRYDALQKVLFEGEKFPFLHGRKLFEVLPDQSQNIVVQLLRELLQLLYAHFALEQKYAISSEPSRTRSDFATHFGLTAGEEKILFQRNTSGNDPDTCKKSPLASVVGWSWATRGKRKVVRVIDEFEDWLKRTKAILEDAWWPLPVFNVLSNLNTLQSDTDARTAGFAASTAIRKLLIDQTKLPQALSAPWTSVNNSKTISSDKIVGVFEGSAVLVETLTFPVDDDGELSDILEERFSKIVRLLSSQSDPDFRVLRCLRYCKQISANSGQLRLISCLSGSNATPTTRTLVGLYHGIKPDQRPSLGLRFNMCHQLAESLFLLHSVDWVHRALRSENVLFLFPDESLNRAALQRAEIRICGFEASRPSVDSSLGPYDNQLARNVYRHPKRWGTPRETFTQVHDVYSLGVILLEIGLWERAEDMISGLKPEQRLPEKVTQYLLRHANERLAHRCGDVFANAVRRCLTLNFDGGDRAEPTMSLTDSHRDSQQRLHKGFLEQVVDPLKILKDVV